MHDPARLGLGWIGLSASLLIGAACGPSDPAAPDAGRFHFEPNAEIVAGAPTVWRLRYQSGPDGVAAGGRLLFRFPHPSSFMAPRNWFPKPDESGRLPVAARLSSGRPAEVVSSSRGWHPHAVEIVLPRGMDRRDTLVLEIGSDDGADPSLAPRYSCEAFAPLVLVDPQGGGEFLRVATDDSVRVVGGDPVAVDLVVPSQVSSGAAVPVTVRLRDRYGNIARPRAPLSVELAFDGSPGDAVTIELGDTGQGWIRVDGPVATRNGVIRVTGRSGLEPSEVLSNPTRVVGPDAERNVYWADLHGHSAQSDGTGDPADYFRFARGPAALDIAALSDHEWQIVESEWEEKQRLCRQLSSPGEFVPFLAWEYSLGGHRVVYARDCGYLPPRVAFDGPKELWEIEYNHAQIHSWAHDSTGRALIDFGDTRQLLADHRNLEALVVPHTSATWHMGNDWDTHDPAVSPLVEIYSAHGSSEGLDERRQVDLFIDRGSVQTALRRGYRLGFIACGDSHDGKPGLTLSGPHSGGVTAIRAERLTRDSVWGALVRRQTWATTGARILVDVSVNGVAGTSVVKSPDPPRIDFEVHGTGTIDAIELIEGGVVIDRSEPQSLDAIGAFVDDRFDGWATYYVRVVQRDGELAWSSPIAVASHTVPIVNDLDAVADPPEVRVEFAVEAGTGAGRFELLRRRGNDGGMDLTGYRLLERLEVEPGIATVVDRDPGGPGITAYYALTWVSGASAAADRKLLGLVSSGLPPTAGDEADPLAVEYFLEEPGAVAIDYIDLKMERVRRIEIDHHEAGRHRFVWDGRDSRGETCRGLHFCVVTSEGHSTQRIPVRIGAQRRGNDAGLGANR
jgi:hypothetical protein